MSMVYPLYYNNVRDVIYADYIPTVESDRLVLTLTEVKQHLNIDLCDSTYDIELQLMIKAVKLQAESITGRTLLTTTFVSYRDYFPGTFVIKKSPVQEVSSVQYYLNGALQTVDPTTYQVTQSRYYPLISLLPGNSWAANYDLKRQTIVITLIAGYGDTESAIPQDLRLGMLNHIANWWANRGDCSCTCDNTLPFATKMIYDSYLIQSLTGLGPLSCYGFGY